MVRIEDTALRSSIASFPESVYTCRQLENGILGFLSNCEDH